MLKLGGRWRGGAGVARDQEGGGMKGLSSEALASLAIKVTMGSV